MKTQNLRKKRRRRTHDDVSNPTEKCDGNFQKIEIGTYFFLDEGVIWTGDKEGIWNFFGKNGKVGRWGS